MGASLSWRCRGIMRNQWRSPLTLSGNCLVLVPQRMSQRTHKIPLPTPREKACIWTSTRSFSSQRANASLNQVKGHLPAPDLGRGRGSTEGAGRGRG